MATDWALFFDRKGLAKGEYGYIEWAKADITRGSVRNRVWCRPEWRKFAELANLQEDQSPFIIRPQINAGNNQGISKSDPHMEGTYHFQSQPSHEDHKFWKALLLGRSAAATDPRDKIYGILGLSGLSNLGIPIDYKCSLEEVFVSFARSLITKSSSLNILRFASNPIGEILRQAGDSQTLSNRYLERDTILSACAHTDLPSWAPCWICDSGVSWETKGYHAGTFLPFTPIFETILTRLGKEREVLYLSGVVFDHIENLSAFHAAEVDKTFPYNSSSTSEASKSPAGPSSTTVMESPYTSISEALWRTVIGNRSSSGCSPAPDTYSCILSIRAAEAWQDEFLSLDLGHWLGKTLTQFRSRNKKLDIFGTKLGDLLKSPSLMSNIRNDAKKWADASSCARKILEYRRLATTRKGYLGVVPAGARSGDVVAILGGSEMVVILRTADEDLQSNLYRVVGLAYIHGLMDGEIIGMVRAGKVRVQDIELC